MIRILIFLLVILFLTALITFFAALDSRIAGEAFGYKFDAPSGIIVGALVFSLIAAIYLTHKIKDIIAFPKKIKAREAEARRSRGVAALTRGLEAVAVGDAGDASHHAKVAERHLDDLALTRLLSAQAAQLSGDNIAATRSFTAMLEAPETEFLGLKGLYAQAVAAGDKQAARGHAERAFRLRSNAKWAFESVVDLGLNEGDWGVVRDAVSKARKNNLLESTEADRAEAALLTADAYAAAASGDERTALSNVEAALKLCADFAPAVALAARAYGDEGKPGKAVKSIEAAFALNAHPAYFAMLIDLYKEEKSEKASAKFRKIADINRESLESLLLNAKADLLEEKYEAAIAHLEKALEKTPSPAAYRLMAETAKGLHGEDAAAVWLEHASLAPRDSQPGADGDFTFSRKGWARIVREYMHHGRLAPPPLQETKAGIPRDEIRLLMAPPVVNEVVDAVVEKASSPADEESASSQKTPVPNNEDGSAGSDDDVERAAGAARGVS